MLEQADSEQRKENSKILANKVVSYFTDKIDVEELIRFADGLQLVDGLGNGSLSPSLSSSSSSVYNSCSSGSSSSSSSTSNGGTFFGESDSDSSIDNDNDNDRGTVMSSSSSTECFVLSVDDYAALIDAVQYADQRTIIALKILSESSQLSDIACSRNYELLKYLRENLKIIDQNDDNYDDDDNNEDIFRSILRLYKRLLYRCRWDVVEAVFVNLIEYLYLDFNSMKLSIRSISHRYKRVFEVYRLILNAFKLIYSNTARIGRSIIERTIGSFIDLLATDSSENDDSLTPFEIVCISDVKVQWLRTLCHNVRTRTVLARSIRTNINLIENIVSSIKRWLRYRNFPPTEVSATTNNLFLSIIIPDNDRRRSTVDYAKFVSCLKILQITCRYRAFSDMLSSGDNDINNNNNNNNHNHIGGVSLIESVSSDISTFFKSISEKNKRTTTIPRTIMRVIIECQVTFWKTLPKEKIIAPLRKLIFESLDDVNTLKFLQIYLADEIELNELIRYDTKYSVYNNNMNLNNYNNIYNINNINNRTRHDVIESRYKWISRNGSSSNNRSSNSIIGSWFDAVKCKIQIIGNTRLIYVLNVCKYFLKNSSVYLILNMHSLKNFIERLIDIYTRTKKGNNCKNSIVESIEELFIVIAGTTLGFNVIYKLAAFRNFAISKIQLKNVIWNSSEWKQIGSHLLTDSEYGVIIRRYYSETFGHFMLNLHKLLNNGVDSENVDSFIEQTLSIAYTISSNFEGVKTLFYGYCTGETCDISVGPNLTTALDLIHLFELGLSPSYEYKYHYTILQLLFILTREFSSAIFLNYHLHYQEKLLYLQKGSIHEDSGQIIIDECSILRSSLLARSYCPDLYNDGELITCLYGSKQFSTTPIYGCETFSEVQKFLQDTKHVTCDNSWIQHARELYRTSMVKDDIKVGTMIELIERTSKTMAKSTHVRKLCISEESKSQKLFPEEYAAISIAVQYGLKRNMLSQLLNNEENLAEIIKVFKTYTGKAHSKSFSGFDCLLTTLFIMVAGCTEKLLQIASYMTVLPVSTYIWPQVTPMCKKKRLIFCHILDWILEQEIPTIFHIMQMNGIHWWTICQIELRNCFWYSMDWISICHFICFTILHSLDYLLYFFISVARVNEQQIMLASNEGNLIKMTKKIFHGCKLSDHTIYMDDLSNKYHTFVTSLLLET